MKKNILTMLLSFFYFAASAQVVVSGKVVNANLEEILSGVNITVKGKIDKSTITDANGKFSIRMDANADAIELSFGGYETIKVKLGANTQNLILFLPIEVTAIEEVSELKNLGGENERKEKRTKKKL